MMSASLHCAAMDTSVPTRALRAIVLAAHLALLLGLPLYGGRLGALAALPLLAPLPGLWQGRLYTLRWASLLLTIYAGLLAAEVWAARAAAALPLALAVLAGVEFCALMLLARGAARARAASS